MPDGVAAIQVVLTTGEITARPADRITFQEGAVLFWVGGVKVSQLQVETIDHVLLPSADTMEEDPKFSVAAVRETHRNAYGKWTDDEDVLLLKLKRDNVPIPDIAALFGRQDSAIHSRLRKLFERGYLKQENKDQS